ncbi:hypothetical protein SmJEL517_g00682 [Synchytrium microbalum]|uniref:PCI domain-containing protein n=1 Tax=Synchytrium microbalum TaxID=1806994 RepID=A0A507CCU1_9FUNG|nr:uncharacterized protein SmJEL517_g00682 [Synchytrium microbalum]TPX37432.1 hypothetical protein SmJEL517_g00682 [Synchytrium microbalum]
MDQNQHWQQQQQQYYYMQQQQQEQPAPPGLNGASSPYNQQTQQYAQYGYDPSTLPPGTAAPAYAYANVQYYYPQAATQQQQQQQYYANGYAATTAYATSPTAGASSSGPTAAQQAQQQSAYNVPPWKTNYQRPTSNTVESRSWLPSIANMHFSSVSEPEYHSVKPVSGSTPPPAGAPVAPTQTSTPQQPTTAKYPPSLKAYVFRAFENVDKNRREAVEEFLQKLVKKAMTDGTLNSTDWDKMPLPQESMDAAATTTTASIAPTPTVKTTKIPANSKPITNKQVNTPPQPTKEPNAKQKKKKIKLEDDVDMEETRIQADLAAIGADDHKRAQRAARFGSEDKVLKPGKRRMQDRHHSDDVNYDDRDPHVIVGTSTTLEKRYLRLTAAPDPSTVRPLYILRKSLDFVLKKFMDDNTNYPYVNDQLKSIRQDMTVQGIKNEFTVEVYEKHARIALEKSDLGEYNQCQTQLKYLYSSGTPSKYTNEFVAYRILYMLHTMNRTELNIEMSELTAEQMNSPPIIHALKIRKAINSTDYHTFFKNYTNAPNMAGYLMDHFVERERIKGLRVMCRAYRPSLAISLVASQLGFIMQNHHTDLVTDQMITEGIRQANEWLHATGVIWIAGSDGSLVSTKQSTLILEAKEKQMVNKGVDIKGQI